MALDDSRPDMNTKANRMVPKYNPNFPKNHNFWRNSSEPAPDSPVPPGFKTNMKIVVTVQQQTSDDNTTSKVATTFK